jgi:hypothetical protein
MAGEVGTVLETALLARLCWDTVITTDHNHVSYERHGERELPLWLLETVAMTGESLTPRQRPSYFGIGLRH